jgi:hypothetical protein
MDMVYVLFVTGLVKLNWQNKKKVILGIKIRHTAIVITAEDSICMDHLKEKYD